MLSSFGPFDFAHFSLGQACGVRRSQKLGASPAFERLMPNPGPTVSSQPGDITFTCVHCSSALVVNAAAAGMTLNCGRCGKPTPVPAIPIRAAESAKAHCQLSDLQRQLKENESQRTEISSYINQLSIQLHRWQLRLQTLNERRQQLEKELRATQVK
jgi:transcription elongation factor Elf1